MSERHENVVQFLRNGAGILNEVLAPIDKTLAANVATALALAANAMEDEVEINDRLARCLIDSLAKGKFQEDAAISVLIEWKKARTNQRSDDEPED